MIVQTVGGSWDEPSGGDEQVPWWGWPFWFIGEALVKLLGLLGVDPIEWFGEDVNGRSRFSRAMARVWLGVIVAGAVGVLWRAIL
jgi:hypothetical protein